MVRNLKRYWNEIANELKERWPDLTLNDLAYIRGDAEKLKEIVEKRRHVSREEAERDVREFLEHLDVRRGIV